MKGGPMFALAIFFILFQNGDKSASTDNVAETTPTIRMLVTHVIYFDNQANLESIEADLGREVAKDKAAYERHGFHVSTETQIGKGIMATSLFQDDHFEIQPPPIRPRE